MANSLPATARGMAIMPDLALIGLREAAESLSISLRTLRRIVLAGGLHSFRIGRRRVVRIDALEAFVARLEAEGTRNGIQ